MKNKKSFFFNERLLAAPEPHKYQVLLDMTSYPLAAAIEYLVVATVRLTSESILCVLNALARENDLAWGTLSIPNALLKRNFLKFLPCTIFLRIKVW